MTELAKDLIALLGNNPSLTPWVLLIVIFVMFALAMGRAGKAALGNVDRLMQQGEQQRVRLEHEIERKDRIIAARDKYIHELEDDRNTTIDFVTSLRQEQAQMMDEIYELKRMNRSLTDSYNDALSLLEIERDKQKG